MKKRDIMLLIGAALLLTFLWMAPEESTRRVPADEIHQRFYELVRQDGKKAAEKFCEDCHNAEQVPFPQDHPSKIRCLLCHKLKQ